MKRIFLSAALALLATSAFAQVKISELPAATTPLDGTELVPLVQGSTVQATVDDVSDAAIAELTGANVISKFSGTCDSTTFLRADGSCQIPAGTGPALTTGTFTATWDVACTTNPTQNFKRVKIGTVVTLTALQNVSCTSDSGGFSTQPAALPATIRPDKQQRLLGGFTTDNGVIDVANSCVRLETDGTISIFRSVTRPCIGTAWTGSGTKAWTVDGDSPAVWTYDIDVVP